jgi:hypothetical protein
MHQASHVIAIPMLTLVLTVAGCGDGKDGGDPDAGTSDPGLRFSKSTPIMMNAPADDVDPDTDGFQVDVSVEPTAADASDYGPVIFRLDDVAQGEPVAWDDDVASIRLTLNVGEPGTKTLNILLATATRTDAEAAEAAWIITVRAH